MISKKLAIEVLNEALATGADYAEIFYEDSDSKGISIENGKVDTSSSNSTTGVGLRLLKENQCIYGYTTDLTRKGLLTLASSLNKSFHGERVVTVTKLDMVKAKNRNPNRPFTQPPKMSPVIGKEALEIPPSTNQTSCCL